MTVYVVVQVRLGDSGITYTNLLATADIDDALVALSDASYEAWRWWTILEVWLGEAPDCYEFNSGDDTSLEGLRKWWGNACDN